MTAPSADPALDGLHAFTPSPTAVADPSPLPHARTGSGGSSEDGGRAATPAAATAASSRNGSSLQDPSSSQHAQPPPPPPPPPGGRLHAHHKRSHFKVRDVAEITYDVGTQGCPPPSAGHTAAWHDRRLFVFGGADGDRMHADVWLLQESNLRWRRVRSSGPAPLARQHHAAAVCGRKLLVYGGFGLGGATVSRQQKPEDSPAQQLLQLSYTRASEPMRWAEHTDGYQLLKCGLLRSVHALDLTTYQWSELSAEGEAIREHSMVCHKNRLYVFGGTMLGGRTNHVRCFDCETLRWLPEKHYNKQLHDAAKDESVMSSPVPTVRSGHAACLHRHEMVVFGGRLSKRAYSAELFAYDLRTRLWRQITPVNESQEPSGRCGHTAAQQGGHLFIYGGTAHSEDDDQKVYFADCHVFQLSACLWRTLDVSAKPDDGLFPRAFHTASPFVTPAGGVKLFVFGGLLHASAGAGAGAGGSPAGGGGGGGSSAPPPSEEYVAEPCLLDIGTVRRRSGAQQPVSPSSPSPRFSPCPPQQQQQQQRRQQQQASPSPRRAFSPPSPQVHPRHATPQPPPHQPRRGYTPTGSPFMEQAGGGGGSYGVVVGGGGGGGGADTPRPWALGTKRTHVEGFGDNVDGGAFATRQLRVNDAKLAGIVTRLAGGAERQRVRQEQLYAKYLPADKGAVVRRPVGKVVRRLYEEALEVAAQRSDVLCSRYLKTNKALRLPGDHVSSIVARLSRPHRSQSHARPPPHPPPPHPPQAGGDSGAEGAPGAAAAAVGRTVQRLYYENTEKIKEAHKELSNRFCPKRAARPISRDGVERLVARLTEM